MLILQNGFWHTFEHQMNYDLKENVCIHTSVYRYTSGNLLLPAMIDIIQNEGKEKKAIWYVF